MYTTRLFLVLALALSVSAEAQTSRRSKKSKSKKPAITKPVPMTQEPDAEPAPSDPGEDPAPTSQIAPEPTATKPAEPAPPPAKPAANSTVVLAVARTANAQPSAARIQAELHDLLGQKPDVQVIDLASAFPPPEPASLKEADALYEQGKEQYDNLDPEAAAGKFLAAADAYEKYPGELKPERLGNTFIFLGASQLLNGDKEAAKRSFVRALAANPGAQPETAMFGADVQTAFTDAQQEFNAQGKGTLTIDSQPSGARVTVRGEDLGVTPLKNVEVHAGRHPVVISLPGYVPYASYPQVAPGKSADLKPQLEPLPAMAAVIDAAAKATTERAFDSDRMPPEASLIAEKVGARYVVLAAVTQKKTNPAEAELQVWDVQTKNRMRGVEIELQSKDPEVGTVAAANRVYSFMTGAMLPGSESASSSSSTVQVMKKPWFWAAVVGGAAVVTGGIIYATQDRGGRPNGPVSGFPGWGF
ncbi:PEGA domain-containing protein [Hyalangium rubrum]|uniref:PEGA domain-containing protein n=1 Tax=Hyalangium rubrum TaxID=3103134 RepID=A0ABU5H054_9BACT|nr:PEGA domain-containing protein [Hyalangium sp. s54d21]MDY7225490.1 PEGA domain-containing protein [Hyalangium sp. s54d21]